MVPANLSKVRNVIWDTKTEWYDLGLELNLSESTLQTIKKDNPTDVKACFREMLSEWLKIRSSEEALCGTQESGHEDSQRTPNISSRYC